MVIDLSRSALLIIDVQNDFCPGGALAVEGGNEVVGPLNLLSSRFAESGGKVVATQDWHPAGHVSFASFHPGAAVFDQVAVAIDSRLPDPLYPSAIEQTLWPDHCVRGSAGAAFHPELDLRSVHLILRKGCRSELDSYSAFYENDRRTPTGLDSWLKGLGCGTVFLGGLATDYCVMFSALDSVRLGFETIILIDACRGVDTPPGSVDRAEARMREAGVRFMRSGDFL